MVWLEPRLFLIMLTMMARAAPLSKGALSLRGVEMDRSSAHALAFRAAALNNASLALSFLDQAPASGGKCMPVCTWHCTTPQCAEVCEPHCEAPQCDVRCTKKDDSNCNFNCGQPSCAVVCPNHGCSASECPKCNAVCGAPKCTLECQGYQPCHSVCEQPLCKWKCRKPDVCPEPKCSMVCESPKACPDASSHVALPPVGGEIVVSSFNVPHVPGGIEVLKAGGTPDYEDSSDAAEVSLNAQMNAINAIATRNGILTQIGERHHPRLNSKSF